MLDGFAGKDCELFWGKGGIENQITKTEVSVFRTDGGFRFQCSAALLILPDTLIKQSQKAKSAL